MPQRFDRYYNSVRNRLLFRWVDVRKKALIRSHLRSARRLRILDLGCGTAAVSAPLCQQNEVFGVDEDPVLLAQAERGGLKTTRGTFESVPFQDQFFDVVIMIDSLEHVESRERTIIEVRRVLKDTGDFVAITPNYSSALWNVAERFALLVSGMQSTGHITPFTHESLEYFLARNFSSSKTGMLNFGMWLYGVGTGRK